MSEDSEAVLDKVAVEAEGARNVEPLHHGEADSISEREVLIGIPEDDLPGPLLIACSHSDHRRAAFVQSSEELLSSPNTEGGEDERMRFDDEDIRREQPVQLRGE